MIKVIIDGKTADVEQDINLAVTLQVADIEQPDVSKTSYTRAMVLPLTPRNRYVFEFTEQPNSRIRWNDRDHTAEVYCDDTLLVAGRPILRSVQDDEVHLDIVGATMQWVRKAADTKLRDALNINGLTLTEESASTSRSESWTGDVRLYPVQREAERLALISPESGDAFYTPRASSLTDLHPFVNVSAVMREVFDGWKPVVVGSALSNALRRMVFSGTLPDSTPEVDEYNKFCIGRVFEDGVKVNVPAYGSATLYQSNIFNSDRLEDNEDFYNGGAFDPTTTAITYNEDVDVAYDVTVRYLSPRIVTNGKIGCVDTVEIMGEQYKLVPAVDYTPVAEVMAAKEVRYLFTNPDFFVLTREDLGLGYDEDLSVWAVREFHLFVGNTEVFEDEQGSWVWTIPTAVSGDIELRAIAYNQDNPSDEREVSRTIPNGKAYYVPAEYSTRQVEVYATVRTAPIFHKAGSGTLDDLNVKIVNNSATVRSITLANGWKAEAVFDKWLGKGHPLTPEVVADENTTLLDVVQGVRHIFNLHFYTNEANGTVYIVQGNSFVSTAAILTPPDLVEVFVDLDGAVEQVFDEEGGAVMIESDKEEVFTLNGSVLSFKLPAAAFPTVDTDKPFTIEEVGQDKGASITFGYRDSAVRKGESEVFALPSKAPANPTVVSNPLFASPKFTNNGEAVVSAEEGEKAYYEGAVNFDVPIVAVRSGDALSTSGLADFATYYAPTVEAYRKGRRITCYVYLRPFEVEAISQPFAGGKGFRSVWTLNINGDTIPCRLERVDGYSPNTREAVKCTFVTL